MTVENTNTEISYTGNDSVTVFAYNFLAYDEDHLFVYLDDVEQTTGFTVSGVGEDSGGDVTFDVAPANNVTVKLERIVPLTQLIEYQQYGPFDAESNERGLDLATMQNIQVQKSIQEKMSKRESAAEDNIVIFDDAGDSKDSGVDINSIGDGSGKMDKIPSAQEDNIIVFDDAGNSKDSGVPITITGDSFAFVTVAELSAGLIQAGGTVHVSDRGYGVFSVVPGGTANGLNILDAGNGNTAVLDTKNKSIDASWYGAVDGAMQTATQKAIDDLILNQDSNGAVGGKVTILPSGGVMDGPIIINNNSVPFSVDSFELKGEGRQTTYLDAAGFAGNAIENRFAIYSKFSDFGIKNAQGNGIFIDDGPDDDEVGFMQTVENCLFADNGLNGVHVTKSYISAFNHNEYLRNTENGFYSSFKVNTSQMHTNEYARYNGNAGFKTDYLVYSSFNTCGSDFNSYGYNILGGRGVNFTACGAEFNNLTGWYFQATDVPGPFEPNWVSMSSCVGADNNNDPNPAIDRPNHTEVFTDNEQVNFVSQKQPVSLIAREKPSWDFRAAGKGSLMSLEDPLMYNKGTAHLNGGYIQVNYSAPRLLHERVVTQGGFTIIGDLKNQGGHSDDFFGEFLVIASNAAYGSGSNVGTAYYKIAVYKHFGAPVVRSADIIYSKGLTQGTDPTHPSFTFEFNADTLIARAVSQTAGTFWFAVTKTCGDAIWTEPDGQPA